MQMHRVPTDNFIVYCLIDEHVKTVTAVRIFYVDRDIEEIIGSNKQTKKVCRTLIE